MASFDVSSLFTNIPMNESIDLCLDLLFENGDIIEHNGCSLDRESFRKLLYSAVKEKRFIFDGKLYDQIYGVATGSSLGPTLANIFICALEKHYLNDSPKRFKPLLYRRNVDDTFCIFNPRDVMFFSTWPTQTRHKKQSFCFQTPNSEQLEISCKQLINAQVISSLGTNQSI